MLVSILHQFLKGLGRLLKYVSILKISLYFTESHPYLGYLYIIKAKYEYKYQEEQTKPKVTAELSQAKNNHLDGKGFHNTLFIISYMECI